MGRSVTAAASNYSNSMKERARAIVEKGTRLSEDVRYVRGFRRSRLEGVLEGVSSYPGGSVASGESNYRNSMKKRPRSIAEQERVCPEISVRPGGPWE